MNVLRFIGLAALAWTVSSENGDDNSPLLHAGGIQQQLETLYASEPADRVQRALIMGLRRAASEESIDLKELACDRDYSRACPPGWVDMDNTCHLNGIAVSLAGMTPWEKGQAVSTKFPCRDDCEQDYSARCPAGWALRNGHECHGPTNYSGSCVGKKIFDLMGWADKRSWSLSCGVPWPCRVPVERNRILDRISSSWLRTDCVSSYKEDCPAGWTSRSDGRCQAPLWMSAPRCGFVVFTQNLSPEQRRAWSIVCNAAWPCIDPSSVLQA